MGNITTREKLREPNVEIFIQQDPHYRRSIPIERRLSSVNQSSTAWACSRRTLPYPRRNRSSE
jgi:hypothetical protein